MTESPLAATELSQALSSIVARTAPSLVSLHGPRSAWSGFVWKPGLVVTADEALPDEGEISVRLPGGSTAVAQVAGRDPTTAVALLRVEAASQAIALSTVGAQAGALALAIGAEEGAPTAALGVVSRAGGAWRSMRGGEIDARIELALRMRRSAEGGLAVDVSGQPIGMLVFGPRRRVLVLPSATVERIAAKLASDGRIARGYLGLGMQPVGIDGGGSGVMVMSVDPKGPGHAAGLHQGDIITAWNSEPIRHFRALLRALGPDSIGKTVTLDIRRAGETRQVSVAVGERPAG